MMRFEDLTSKDLAKLPGLTFDHYYIGEEMIYMHLFNQKKMHWYLSEYGPINKKFFGFYENKSDGLASGYCTLEDVLNYSKKGGAWEPIVDEDWKPTIAKEIPILTEYIKMMIIQPDIT